MSSANSKHFTSISFDSFSSSIEAEIPFFVRGKLTCRPFYVCHNACDVFYMSETVIKEIINIIPN